MDEQLQPQNSGPARRDRGRIAPAAFVAALVGGGLVGSVIGAPAISQALQSDETTTTTASTSDTDDATTTPASGTSDGDTQECGPGGPLLGRFGGLAAAAEALGVTEDELRESLRDGSSLADVAEAEGVDVQAVIDALVEAATAEIDERVAAGTLDEERAAELKADLVERVTARVNGEGGFFGHGPGGRRGPGAGPGDEPPEDDEATATTQPEGS